MNLPDLKIRVDEEMHGWLKTESSRRDVSINALVNEVLAEARKMQIRGKGWQRTRSLGHSKVRHTVSFYRHQI